MANIQIDFSGFDELNNRINELNDQQALSDIKQKAVKDMAGVYLRNAKKNTPEGEKLSNEIKRKDGTTKIYRTESEHMRRSWFADKVIREGDSIKVKVHNTASYASYVNDGHRQTPGRYVPVLGKRLIKSWVDGLFIHEKAFSRVEANANKILSRRIDKYLGRWSKD